MVQAAKNASERVKSGWLFHSVNFDLPQLLFLNQIS